MARKKKHRAEVPQGDDITGNNETTTPADQTGNIAPDEDEDTGKQIPLAEGDIFKMAASLLEAIKNEPATDKAEFYRQTLDKGGVMSRLRVLRKNPGMSPAKLGEFDQIIEEIKGLIESKLDGYKPGKKSATPQAQVEKKPAQVSKPVAPPVKPPAPPEDEARLKYFAQQVERSLIHDTARIPMSKQACFNWIKGSGPQYDVVINPSVQNPGMSIVTISIGQYTEDLQPLKLHD